MNGDLPLLVPDWPAPPRVQAAVTLRQGGVSPPPYDSMNPADHVGDTPQYVDENRRRLREALELPQEPFWLNQTHGTTVVDVDTAPDNHADGSVAFGPTRPCVVLTADCLPVLLCDLQGNRVAALHAGWRGLVAGILDAGVARLNCPGDQLMAWLGPAIGPQAFEVGDEVRRAFVEHDARAVEAFLPGEGDKWLADLYVLARQRLAAAGVMRVYGGGLCTVSDPERFFSYRRDGACGRMASLIWLRDSNGL